MAGGAEVVRFPFGDRADHDNRDYCEASGEVILGDANDDGILDFVLAFVRRDSDEESPWFSVAIFTGEARGGFAPGVILERDISLADGDISLDRDAVIVTPDVADDAARRYRWDPERRRHVYVSDEPEEPTYPPAAQT